MAGTDIIESGNEINMIDPVARWASANILAYATSKKVPRDARMESNTPNVFKEREVFQDLLFDAEAPTVIESRSAVMEWLRLVHLQASAVITETFDFKEITSKELGGLQKKRKLTNDGRKLVTLLVLGENLKMMLSLTNPNVVMSTFGTDEPVEAISFDNVTSDIKDMCWEITSQIIMLLFSIQMPTQPPPQVHGGYLQNEDSEEEEEEDTGVSSDGDNPFGKDEEEEEEKSV
jgi:hypothetical protein